ncbi:MAG: hypothetical protein IPG90_21610 [Bacteroidetes bacterium]|nr:hypothetical protein [Bacteroidota bacterium]
MKLIIYLSLLLISITVFAQQNSAPNHRTQTLQEEIIWFTYYDLPWIGSSPTRIVNNSDGTISTCMNYSPTANAGYPDAEGYYVYFDGLIGYRIQMQVPGAPYIRQSGSHNYFRN